MKTIIAAWAFIYVTAPVFAQNNTAIPFPKTIEVTGSAELEVIPDEIYVQVDLREYKKKGEKVELETIKTNFLNKCKAVGIADADVSIASYEGSNYNYWYWRRSKKSPDLLSSIAYQVKFTNSKKMDELVDVLDDEATTNFNVTKVSHSKLADYRKDLKIKAIKAAKDKSNYLAEAIDEKAGQAIQIIEFDGTDPANPFLDYWLRDKQNMQSNRIYSNTLPDKTGTVVADFKRIKLRYEVKVVFALK